MLPKDAIVGVTVSSVEEAQTAIAQGADYLGIGTVFATQTSESLLSFSQKTLTSAAKKTQNQ